MTADNEWFIKTQSGRSGPFEFKQLQYFADRGKIKPNTAVGRGDSQWIKAKRVDGLYFPGEPPSNGGQDERPVMPHSAVDGFMTQSSPFGIPPRDSEFSGILQDSNAALSDDQVAGDEAVQTKPSDDPPQVKPDDTRSSGLPDGADLDQDQSAREAELSDREGSIATREAKLATREAELASRESAFSDREASFAARESVLRDREAKCDSLETAIRSRESNLSYREAEVELREAEVTRRETELRRREAQLLVRETESAES